MRQHIESLIDHYAPHVSVHRWAPIADFVRELVRTCEPETEALARRLLTFITNYVLWGIGHGYSMTREILAEKRLLTFYLQDTVSSPGDTQRRKQAASHLLASVLGTRIPYSTSGRTPVPYTPAELHAMRLWAAAQPTGRQIRKATSLLSLIAGAGLTLGEMVAVRAHEVTRHGDLMTVTVADGRNPRTVPVLRSWMARLQEVVESTSSGNRLFESKSVSATPGDTLREFLDHTQMMTVRPEPSRLRATWAFTLLQAHVPIPTFMTLAGLSSSTSLEKYLGFMPTVGFDFVRDTEAAL